MKKTLALDQLREKPREYQSIIMAINSDHKHPVNYFRHPLHKKAFEALNALEEKIPGLIFQIVGRGYNFL